MRLTQALSWFGLEVSLDFYVGPTTVDDEPEPVCEAGSYTSTVIGFAPSVEPDWEKPLNRYDEPDEAE